MLRKSIVLIWLILALSPLAAQPPEVPVLTPQVLNVYPHDDRAFTQGLIWDDGDLYESTGQWGQSSLRRVDIESGVPLQQIALDDVYFAEGLERVGDHLIQLTWRAGKAFFYDFETLELLDTVNYAGEGWGLCYDGRYLFMSDSTAYLSIRDPETFDLIFRGAVTFEEQIIPPQLLNELECVGGFVYANAWNRDYIFKIDKFTGVITTIIDASGLLTESEKTALDPGSVLNGIAWSPESETFFITGKNWPKLFEVVFTES